FFFQAEAGIRYRNVTGVQTCALPISDEGHRNDDDVVLRRRVHGGELVPHADPPGGQVLEIPAHCRRHHAVETVSHDLGVAQDGAVCAPHEFVRGLGLAGTERAVDPDDHDSEGALRPVRARRRPRESALSATGSGSANTSKVRMSSTTSRPCPSAQAASSSASSESQVSGDRSWAWTTSSITRSASRSRTGISARRWRTIASAPGALTNSL